MARRVRCRKPRCIIWDGPADSTLSRARLALCAPRARGARDGAEGGRGTGEPTEDVGGLEIAMHDVCIVQVPQAGADLMLQTAAARGGGWGAGGVRRGKLTGSRGLTARARGSSRPARPRPREAGREGASAHHYPLHVRMCPRLHARVHHLAQIPVAPFQAHPDLRPAPRHNTQLGHMKQVRAGATATATATAPLPPAAHMLTHARLCSRACARARVCMCIARARVCMCIARGLVRWPRGGRARTLSKRVRSGGMSTVWQCTMLGWWHCRRMVISRSVRRASSVVRKMSCQKGWRAARREARRNRGLGQQRGNVDIKRGYNAGTQRAPART